VDGHAWCKTSSGRKASLVRAASRNLPAQLTNVAKLGVRPTGACMNMPRRGWIYGPKVEVQQPVNRSDSCWRHRSPSSSICVASTSSAGDRSRSSPCRRRSRGWGPSRYAQSPSSDQAEPSTRRNPLGEVPTERAGSARRVGNCTCRSPARHRAAARAEEPTTVRARWRGWGPGLDAPRADASGETGQVNPDTHHDGPRSPATR
jgi:hypothetical protein